MVKLSRQDWLSRLVVWGRCRDRPGPASRLPRSRCGYGYQTTCSLLAGGGGPPLRSRGRCLAALRDPGGAESWLQNFPASPAGQRQLMVQQGQSIPGAQGATFGLVLKVANTGGKYGAHWDPRCIFAEFVREAGRRSCGERSQQSNENFVCPSAGGRRVRVRFGRGFPR